MGTCPTLHPGHTLAAGDWVDGLGAGIASLSLLRILESESELRQVGVPEGGGEWPAPGGAFDLLYTRRSDI
jgi:hypothetical protein